MSVVVELSAVIVAKTDERPLLLTVRASAGPNWGLPTGPLDPTGDRTLEQALRRWARTSAGIGLG